MNEENYNYQAFFKYKPDVTNELIDLSQSIEDVPSEYVLKVFDYYFWSYYMFDPEIVENVIKTNNIRFCELLSQYEEQYEPETQPFPYVWNQLLKVGILSAKSNDIVPWLLKNGKTEPQELVRILIKNPETVDEITHLLVQHNIYVEVPKFYSGEELIEFLMNITKLASNGTLLANLFKHLRGFEIPLQYFNRLAEINNPMFEIEDYAYLMNYKSSVVKSNAGNLFIDYVITHRYDLLIALLAQYNPSYASMTELDLRFDEILERFMEEQIPISCDSTQKGPVFVNAVLKKLFSLDVDYDLALDFFDFMESLKLPKEFFTERHSHISMGFFSYDLSVNQYVRLFEYYPGDLYADGKRLVWEYCMEGGRPNIITALLRKVTGNMDISTKIADYYMKLHYALSRLLNYSKLIFRTPKEQREVEYIKDILRKMHEEDPSNYVKIAFTAWVWGEQKHILNELIDYIESL